LLERDLERLDDPAVLDPRRTGRLAGPAVQAELQVLADARPHLEPAVGDRAHQVDPAARTVILVAGLEVRRTARRAQTAMDTFLVATIRDLLREPIEVDRRRRHGLVARRARGRLFHRRRHLHQLQALVAGGKWSMAGGRWPCTMTIRPHPPGLG